MSIENPEQNQDQELEAQIGVLADALYSYDEGKRNRYLKRLGLDESVDRSQVENAFEGRLQNYRERKTELEKQLPNLKEQLKKFASDKGVIFRQDPEAIPVRFIDPLLLIGKEGPKRSLFSQEHNFISFDVNHSLNVLAHEFGHATAYDPATRQGGFKKYSETGYSGNTWLDEGCTMMVEFGTAPTKIENVRDTNDEMYNAYFWLTNLFRDKLGLSQIELLKAYYAQEPDRSNLEQKIKDKFHCSIEDLGDLFLGFNEESRQTMEKILNGEEVILKSRAGSGIDKKNEKLAKIFPNIKTEIIGTKSN